MIKMILRENLVFQVNSQLNNAYFHPAAILHLLEVVCLDRIDHPTIVAKQ